MKTKLKTIEVAEVLELLEDLDTNLEYLMNVCTKKRFDANIRGNENDAIRFEGKREGLATSKKHLRVLIQQLSSKQ